MLDLRADAKDEAPVHPSQIRRKTSYKETAVNLLKASLAQKEESPEQVERQSRQRADGPVLSKTKPRVPVTVIELSDSDSEAEWTLDAEPKVTSQPQRKHIPITKEPEESSKLVQQITTLRSSESESLVTSAAPNMRSVKS